MKYVKFGKMISLMIVSLLIFNGVGMAQIANEEIKKIEDALPSKATVMVEEPRKLLVFSLSKGYKHSAIPYAAKMLEIMGKKTGAFETVYSEDISVFKADKLKQFDAICFNNTTQLKFEDPALRKSLMDFVKGGKGIIGIHAATDNFYTWSEAAEMMGGVFDGHPWNAKGTWKVKIEDPGHPLNAAFQGKDFTVVDEIYRVRPRNLRVNCRVLLRLDMKNKANLSAKGVKITDRDVPISYIRTMGKGRVFYCSFGHNAHIYWDSAILKHYLDGIQYAFGDLKADATPVPFNIEKAVEIKEVEELLNSISTYEYGQSREKLTDLSDLLRLTSISDKLSNEIEEEFIDFLESDASLASKQYICERLSIFGSKKSIATLIEMLEDPGTVDMALFALSRIPDKEVDDELRDVLGDTEGRVKVGIITALGARKDQKAASELLLLMNSMDPKIASAAIWSLGQIGGREVAQALDGVRINHTLKTEITDAYLQCAEGFIEEGNKNGANEIYQNLYESVEEPQFQYAALRGIILTSEKNGSELILRVLRGDQKDMYSSAIQLVREIPPSEDVSAIAQALPEFSETSQIQLLAALAGRKEPEVIQVMQNQLRSDNEEVRIAALRALAQSGDEKDVSLFAELAATKEGKEREKAREGLYRLRGSKVDQTILKNLPDSEPNVKIEYINSVFERQISQGVPLLLTAAEDANQKVRLASIKAIRETASPQFLDQAVKLLVDPKSEQERKELEKAVIAVALRISEGEPQVGNILTQLEKTKDIKTRISLLEVLGKLGNPDALSVLRSSLKDKNAEITAAAIRALSSWPNSTPINDLLGVAQKTKNEKFRVLALRGYVRLISFESEKSSEEILEMYQTAMTLTSNTNEKRLVLSGLSEVESLDALKFAVQYLENQELQQEAAIAVINIASGLEEAESQQLKPILYKVLSIVANEPSKKKCRELINEMERFEDHITLWQVSGPYKKSDVDLFEFPFPPETNDRDKAIWELVPASTDKDNYWHIDLGKIYGTSGRVAYLRNKVWSEANQEVQLEIGSNDAVKAWINNTLVHSNNVSRGVAPGDDKVKASLKKGWNMLLLKIINVGGAWGACARIRDIEGAHLAGIKFAIEE
jgi:type 1 glutamine amidotransferase